MPRYVPIDEAAELECQADNARAVALELDAEGEGVLAERLRAQADNLVRRARLIYPRPTEHALRRAA